MAQAIKSGFSVDVVAQGIVDHLLLFIEATNIENTL